MYLDELTPLEQSWYREGARDVSAAFDLTVSCTPTQSRSANGEVVLADAQLLAKRGRSPTTTSP